MEENGGEGKGAGAGDGVEWQGEGAGWEGVGRLSLCGGRGTLCWVGLPRGVQAGEIDVCSSFCGVHDTGWSGVLRLGQ